MHVRQGYEPLVLGLVPLSLSDGCSGQVLPECLRSQQRDGAPRMRRGAIRGRECQASEHLMDHLACRSWAGQCLTDYARFCTRIRAGARPNAKVSMMYMSKYPASADYDFESKRHSIVCRELTRWAP
jgi:hypothetical protein